jgi:Fe2+ transport system protein FeoA
MLLNRTPAGTMIRILEISGTRYLRRSLSQLGIQIGDIVHVQRRVPYGGPVLILHRGTQVALGRSLAERIQVERLDSHLL